MAVGHLHSLAPLLDALAEAAEKSAVAAHRAVKRVRRKRVGAVLRPGPDTPLWNELAQAAALQLQRYGEQAKLARILGITRQRLHVYLRSKTACPDAERTLQLLVWLGSRQRGNDPA